ncbi:Hsp90 protein-domain-containing protein [Lobosporangium transversale]|uniref:Heat shock protein 75 kDa, mitochondrial n=1 Tax=Lobosporangium transversale TaxID=64571 RepID=A0A1Y2GZD1_9FUNG|nr:Hsp90 protein-domain-containing protein [Lobosporangium transversale]ORZ27635.1 Hsp90 protein-domain-containing protein [Lobosporangium transversale]|eukprot:XP_021885338.1 Hsp90 protein-domain-containing protein [Lobosporangium transversale]
MLRSLARTALAARSRSINSASATPVAKAYYSTALRSTVIPVGRKTTHLVHNSIRSFVTETGSSADQEQEEKVIGESKKKTFQAETRKLLDIVTHSLYSEKEVFVRELVSNASDALEKLRHTQLTDASLDTGKPLEIHISVDEAKGTFTIQDFGIGMTEEEAISNLGTIARSGSKAFLENLKAEETTGSGVVGSTKEKIIGQFGVGFYSAFMVGSEIKVYTRSAKPGSKGYCWTSDGSGSYEIAEAENVAVGTKIVITLREDCKEYAKEDRIEKIIKKYSNFVDYPVHLNNKKINAVQPLWTKDKNEISEQEHIEFYRYVAGAWDNPQFKLVYKTDSPLAISSLLYIPQRHMEILGMQREEPGVSLYSRKVMIQAKSKALLPEWLRFVKGVVDCEDLPLNVSRELLQDQSLSKLRQVLTGRVIKWLENESKADPKAYNHFFEEFGNFIKEGVCTENENNRPNVAKLLRYESSAGSSGEVFSLKEYVDRMKEGQENIYYTCVPKRKFAEESPYFEEFKEKGIEVLFLYDTVDEFVVNNLRQVGQHKLVSIDAADIQDAALQKPIKDDADSSKSEDNLLSKEEAKLEAENIADWFRQTLGMQVRKVEVSKRHMSHPAVVTEHDSPAVRKMMAMMSGAAKAGEASMPPTPTSLEINVNHPIIKKVWSVKSQDPEFAKQVAEQIYDNALIAAGVLDDPRSMLKRLNRIMEASLSAADASKSKDNVMQSKKIEVVEGEKV